MITETEHAKQSVRGSKSNAHEAHDDEQNMYTPVLLPPNLCLRPNSNYLHPLTSHHKDECIDEEKEVQL